MADNTPTAADHGEFVDLRRRVAEALMRAQYPTYRGEPTHGQFDLADAVIADLRLTAQKRRHWTLYNAREGAHRMTVMQGDDGVWSIEDARKRMAPYHQDGDGYEVVERVQVWWSTPSEMTTPLPAAAQEGDQ